MEGLQKPTVTIKVKFKGSKLATGSSKMPAAVVSVPFMRKLTALNKSMLEFTANSTYKKPKSATPSSATGTSAGASSSVLGDATARSKRRKIGELDVTIPAAAPSLSSAHPNGIEPAPSQNQDGAIPAFSGDGDKRHPSAVGTPSVGGLCLPASYASASTASRFYTPQWTRKQHNKNIESIDPDAMEIACDYDLWLLLEAQRVFAPFSYKTHDMNVLNLQDTGSAEVLARWAVPPLTGGGAGGGAGACHTEDDAGAGAGAGSNARTSIAAEGSGEGDVCRITGSGVQYAPPSSSGAGAVSAGASSGAVPAASGSVSWLLPSPSGYTLPAPLANMGGFASYGSMLGGLPAPMAMPAYPPQTTYGAPQTIYGAPQTTYGAPQTMYGAPQTTYGAPQTIYGAPQTTYGAPQTMYGVPQGFGYPVPPGYGSIVAYPGIPAVLSSSAGTGSWLGPSGGGGGVGVGVVGAGGKGGELPPLLSLLAQSRGVDDTFDTGSNPPPPLLPTLWPSAHREEPSSVRPASASVVVVEEESDIDQQIAYMDEELRAQQLENNRRIASLRRDALQTAAVRCELKEQQKQIDRERVVLHRWRRTSGYTLPGSSKGLNAGGAGSGNATNGAAGKIKHVHRKKHGGY